MRDLILVDGNRRPPTNNGHMCTERRVCVCVCVCGPGFTVASKSYYDRFTERRVVIERLLMDIKDWKLQDCMQRANTDVQLFVGRTETSFF